MKSDGIASERASGYENFKRLQGLGRGANPFSAIEQRVRAALREAQERGKAEGD